MNQRSAERSSFVRDIPFARVDCSGRELEYVGQVLESGWLTTASKSKELEEKFAELIGCKHAIAVNSCTSALHLALDACNIGTGDKVLLPSLTFTATAEVVRYMGADPVLMDVDKTTGCISGELVAEALERHSDIKAVLAVHYGGYPIEMTNSLGSGLADICNAHGVHLVNDSAHALPAHRGGVYIGYEGDITCFSFYANKTMTTGEGGMLTTNSDDIAKRARLMRLHGIDRDAWDRYTKQSGAWEYDVTAPGFKYNLPDLNAAVGLAQFERLEDMRRKRQNCAAFYQNELADIGAIRLFESDVAPEEHAWHLFPIVVDPEGTFSRNELINFLAENGIGTSVHYKPIHRLKYYRERYSLNPRDYPVTEEIWQGCVSLPIYNLLEEKDLRYISDSIHLFFQECELPQAQHNIRERPTSMEAHAIPNTTS